MSRDVDVRPASFWRRHAREFLGLAIVLLAAHDIFGAHGFIAMRRTQRELAGIRANMDRLNNENKALAGQIRDLKTDPTTIERLAREEMGLARPGEVIIKLPPPVASGSDSGSDSNATPSH